MTRIRFLPLLFLACLVFTSCASKNTSIGNPPQITVANAVNALAQAVDEKGNPVTLHNAGLIAFEFKAWPSIETINADLTQEFGQSFTFVMPKE